MKKQQFAEQDLAALAKSVRQKAGKTRAQAARDMDVSQTSIFNAEETPQHGMLKLRVRIIEAYSSFKVSGPIFYLTQK